MKDTVFYSKQTFSFKGILRSFDQPLVMGILNITPDSFYSNSRFQNINEILKKVDDMIQDGVDVIDVGGYSSRPGATDISVKEEIERVVDVIDAIHSAHPNLIISIDTFRSEVADEAIKSGASMINDISGGQLDENIFEMAAKNKVPYVLMHMKGTPKTMNSLTNYENLLKEIAFYFSSRIKLAKQKGVNDIILDPGFGFSKTVSQNFELLSKLSELNIFELPLLVGVSRKSMIYKTLNSSAEESLNGTTALNTVALLNGASILRVHDVKEAKETINLIAKLSLAH